MSILGKVLPKRGNGENYYLSLLITYHSVECALWTINEKRLQVVELGLASLAADSDILDVAAEAIDQACEKADIDAKDVILGLPDAWISQNQILPQYFEKLKELAENLDIVPFAFVAENHAICNRLKGHYGSLLSGFLLNIDNDNITLSSIDAGHLGTTRYVRSSQQELEQGLQKVFSHFTPPSGELSVYVYGSPLDPSIEETVRSLALFADRKPNVVLLPSDYPIRAIALAGAVDRGNTMQMHVEDEAQTQETQPVSTTPVSVVPVMAVTEVPEVTAEAAAEELPENDLQEVEDNSSDTIEPNQEPPSESDNIVQLPEGFSRELEPEPELNHEQASVTKHEEIPVHPMPEEVPAPQVMPTTAVPAAIHPLHASMEAQRPLHPLDPGLDQRESNSTTPSRKMRIRGPLAMVTGLLSPLSGILGRVFGIGSGVLRGGAKRGALLLVPITLIIIAAVLFFTVPKAKVSVAFAPKELPGNATITVTSSVTSVDVAAQKIPGSTLTTEVSGDQAGTATGKKKVGEKAKGTVTIYNKTSGAKSFGAGTTLQAGSVSFVLDQAVSVPARTATESAQRDIVIRSGRATASATAAEIGTESNVSSDTNFTIKGFDKDSFDASANSAFTGGTAKDVTVITDTDVKKAEADLVKSLQAKAKGDLTQKIPTNQKIVDESVLVSITKKSTSKKVGDEASSFTVSATAKAQGISFSPDDLKKLAETAITSQIPEGYMLSSLDTSQAPSVKKVEKNGDASLAWQYAAKLVPKIDTTQYTKKIAGKSFASATATLQAFPDVRTVTVDVQPGIFAIPKRLPFKSSAIEITATATQ